MVQSYWKRYRDRVRATCMRPFDDKQDLAYWQDHLFAVSMSWLVPLSLIALIPGIYASWSTGASILVWINIFVLPYFLFLVLAPGLSVTSRKLLSVGGIYLISAVLLLELSSFGPGLLYLLAVNMLTVLILGRFWGLISVTLNLLISVIGVLIIQYNLFETLRIHEYTTLTWIGVSSNLVFLSLISVVMIPLLFDGLQATIVRQRELERELVDANEELESFATVASHDMKEPLRMIHSFMALLEKRYERALDEKGKQYIHFARDGARRMTDLVDDLLDYSRIGRKYTRFEEVDLEEVAEGVERLYRSEVKALSGQLHVDTLPTVRAVPVAMRMVMQNLISNAVKYHREGTPLRVQIRSRMSEQYWVVEVKDNGIGIDKKYHEEVFQLFRRLHTREETTGTGLGLAICRKIMEQHEGAIDVSSRPGEGSTFRLYFPLSSSTGQRRNGQEREEG